ncbi:hypothetical protein GCM10007856_50260 [Azospirillum oryzae]|nr:hypothetical protein GCM10007856_50260 [Azospirillum oryzae]
MTAVERQRLRPILREQHTVTVAFQIRPDQVAKEQGIIDDKNIRFHHNTHAVRKDSVRADLSKLPVAMG